MLALEREHLPGGGGPQSGHDRENLFEPIETLRCLGERDRVGSMLLGIPAGADAEVFGGSSDPEQVVV